MTKTWEDYKGPNLGEKHRRDELAQVTAAYLKKDQSSCCVEEIEARKKWAEAENAKTASTTTVSIERTPSSVRQFDTGANRDTDTGKLDFDGFLSPIVLNAYATYMNFNRSLANGSVRDSDNWQKGIPIPVYRKSAWRHFFDAWSISRGHGGKETLVWALCGVLFNISGWLHELLKDNPAELYRALDHETKVRDKLRAAAAADVSPPPSQG